MGVHHSKSKKSTKVHEDKKASTPERPKSATGVRKPRDAAHENSITGFGGDVSAKYHVEAKVLGEGHYGTVRRCQDRETGVWYALKTIKKAKVKRADYLRREIDLLLTVNHPNIINLVDVFEDKFNLQIVCELCTGGELFDAIIEKSKSAEGHYSEHDASTLIRKVLSAIDHCHAEHDIVHRDLKPENFLFKGPGKGEGEPVIIDFGLSKMTDQPNDHMATRVGTPYYIAPEVLNRDYTKACDLWSIGVICYILLCGYPPFYGDNDAAIFKMIMSGTFDYPAQEWGNISQEAKDFIKKLLNLDASERPTAAEAMQDKWFQVAHAEPVPIVASVGSRLESFVGMSKLKKHALQVIAEHLTEKEISDVKKMFKDLDVNKKGTLTVVELKSALVEFPHIQSQIEELVDGIDLDHNHTVDYNEFLAATLSRNTFIREENIHIAFDHFDEDKTGSITLANLIHIFGSEQHALEVIGENDYDGDRAINFEEFRSMMMEHEKYSKHLHHSNRDPSFSERGSKGAAEH
mmetsp:Transcript_4010/g.5291  ORF Transcript_4010/g.5291 Transcript_4010/m.5291 type:complete len:520 (+) Transcript_4010:88-1647(+)|eukprot:CAMPEP_0114339800 /NCGR_PEP_ID=MMETSP0101-20121206/7960_1 /TAXON_ID=38822 ORGANISM="Pteridomonas danica, Strain PT" /NCGR_SAMPLE_ID=MMETSP0101 /ASSEMBLY_ACC=CAM_ASM_000211 /LENGTH=519 /DNA_ID=CAMNT_0001472867 /DNA_START=67 /DNA_END=1626 /DNA_ORIENTATION=+